MKARKLKGLPWALKAGVNEGALRNFLAGRSSTLRISTLEKLAEAADATLSEVIGEKITESRAPKDIVAIRRLQVRASMGGGVEIDSEVESEPVFFRRRWIEDIIESEPAQMRVIDMTGDSMLPTIRDGDIGLALLHAPFESGKCYALWDGRGLVVKRLEGSISDPDRLRVISDNVALHPPYEVHADEVHIIARIVWRGGKI